MEYENNPLLDEAYDWAYQRAEEEGDIDIEYDYEIIDAWAEEYYMYLISLRE